MDTGILHSPIPLEDFKAVLGIDDRENALSRYCLTIATYSIEQYCKRRLLRRKHTDYLTFAGEYIFSLREYPVRRVLAVWAATAGTVQRGKTLLTPENLVDPKHYYCISDEGIHEDIPFSLVLRPPCRLTQEEMGRKVRYLAGYVPGKAPADLASACLELAAGPKSFAVKWKFSWPYAMPHYLSTRSMFRVHYWAWNMSRYRGPPPRSGFLIGMTRNVRGNGKDGEHLEASMPENGRQLLEPYRRRVI